MPIRVDDDLPVKKNTGGRKYLCNGFRQSHSSGYQTIGYIDTEFNAFKAGHRASIDAESFQYAASGKYFPDTDDDV